ncbi:imidazole glycerol phosphate synthase subunit HisH [Candidatus Micrarchaeota archaeon]|nr:imidazole glycerol phosphate synthase subunit HisH [Candidatus Micrarchaeota archaeon]
MIGIIDYGMGNLRSVSKAFELIGAEVIVSGDTNELVKADKLVLPGVGAFGDGMNNLRKLGLIEFMHSQVMVNKKPLLGICLGMQLLAEKGYERGENKGLGFVAGEVKKFDMGERNLKVPHVGWNEVKFKEEGLFRGIKSGSCFYFVHSYHLICKEPKDAIGTTEYGYTFTSAVNKGNIFGTQFHPEKSQEAGLKLLENYLKR